jgi:hypothetical protein
MYEALHQPKDRLPLQLGGTGCRAASSMKPPSKSAIAWISTGQRAQRILHTAISILDVIRTVAGPAHSGLSVAAGKPLMAFLNPGHLIARFTISLKYRSLSIPLLTSSCFSKFPQLLSLYLSVIVLSCWRGPPSFLWT